VRRGGQQVAIVGPDFVESGLDCGNYMDGVAGAQKHFMRQSAGQGLDSVQDVIRDWEKPPYFALHVCKKLVSRGARRSGRQRAFTQVSVKCASQFRHDKRGGVESFA
jgi:hypothetical protein